MRGLALPKICMNCPDVYGRSFIHDDPEPRLKDLSPPALGDH